MMRNNIITLIEERDLNELKLLLKSAFNNDIDYETMKDFYKECKKNKNLYILGYFINDLLVGTVALSIILLPSGKEATLWDLVIKEEYRKLGIATKLMNKVEEIAKRENIKRIWLFSGFQRDSAHQLYKKLGYDENRDKAFVKELQ